MVLVHPEYAILILEVNELKETIADLTVEKDMLIHYVCRDLEIDYMLKIGALEYKLFIAQNKVERAKRKLELIEAKLSKKKPVDLEKIEAKLNREFKAKDKLEKDMLADIDYAIEISALEMIDYDIVEEMNIEYFKLQKIYNPELDFSVSLEKAKIYKKIEKYYQKCNYKKLKKLAKDYEDEIFQDEISNLRLLKEKYLGIIKEKQREIRKIKNTFPYNQKVILKNEILCSRKKENINTTIIETNTELKKIEKKISAKLKNL